MKSPDSDTGQRYAGPPSGHDGAAARSWCEPGGLTRGGALCAIPVLTFVLFQLRFLVPMGADGPHIADICSMPDRWPFYYRSFLTCLLHRSTWQLTQFWEFSGDDAVALSSALAGSLAVLALWRLCRHPLFLFINICAGSFLVFVGHVETYAWVGAGFLWMMAAIREYLLDRVDGGAVMWAYCIAFSMHMLMLFYFPVVALTLAKGRPASRRALLTPVILLGAAVLILPFVFESPGGTELELDRFVPLTQKTTHNHHFLMFEAEHAEVLWIFACGADIPVRALLFPLAWMGVPGWEDAFQTRIPDNNGLPIDRLGLPVSFLLLFLFRKRIQGYFLRLSLSAVGLGVAWTLVWNPDWGLLDWDLFSQFALPLHLLVGLLILPERSAYVVDPVYSAPESGTSVSQSVPG